MVFLSKGHGVRGPDRPETAEPANGESLLKTAGPPVGFSDFRKEGRMGSRIANEPLPTALPKGTSRKHTLA